MPPPDAAPPVLVRDVARLSIRTALRGSSLDTVLLGEQSEFALLLAIALHSTLPRLHPDITDHCIAEQYASLSIAQLSTLDAQTIITLATLTRTLPRPRKIDPVYPGTAPPRASGSCTSDWRERPSIDASTAVARRAPRCCGPVVCATSQTRDLQGLHWSRRAADYNHCDLTTMLGDVQDESNADGSVAEISRSNLLGPGIREASLPELGEGGSWSTCTPAARLIRQRRQEHAPIPLAYCVQA